MLQSSPAQLGYRQPAEWHPHQACWLAFPCNSQEWGEQLPTVQTEFIDLCRAIADPDPVTGQPRGEQLEILVLDAAWHAEVAARLEGVPARLHQIAYGDIWLRDTAPIFIQNQDRQIATVRFQTNGWGGKYCFPADLALAPTLAKQVGYPDFAFPLIMEGGSLETDGEGTCLTTRQCLLNPNRNPGLSQADIEATLQAAFGFQKILWLDQGLLNDHTDGHIDTLARFVAPGVVVCMQAQTADDPNAAVLQEIAAQLAGFTDAQGRKLEVITIPAPGRVLSIRGEILPASYANFYIGNRVVVVPTYGSPADAEAVAGIAALFPGRKTVGLSAWGIVHGGGAFHGITQQQIK